ncbi:MAG: ACP S-malonyltransferase [Acidobacteria bacterium]|nr:ACP S-malonyltransferase [Acidobacteriota bacterium]
MSDQSSIENRQSKIAFLFPGQGSQAVGMGKDLFDNFAASREVFEEANDALGFKLSEMCFAGDDADLQLTTNTQPAILTTSVAAFRAMKSENFPMPNFVAGHSLGEYSALVAADAISFFDAVKTVRERGTYMQEAVPVGVGAMAAILDLPLETIEIACEEASQGEVCSPANINSANGVETFIEVGAGKVLSGLVKQINRDVRCLNIENSTTLKEALEIL